jgi:hypothetical protein
MQTCLWLSTSLMMNTQGRLTLWARTSATAPCHSLSWWAECRAVGAPTLQS